MRRLTYRASMVIAVAAALWGQGCGCSESSGGPCPDPGPECCLGDMDCQGPSDEDYMACCTVTNECFALPDDPGEEDDGCDPGYTCDNVLDIVLVEEEDGCYVDWSCCDAREPLRAGKVGTHSSMDVADDGTIWLSGYLAGPDEENQYGDLVCGTWDAEAGEPDWEIVDGVPWDVEPYAPPDGFRGGINEPGDDVGTYTRIALDASGDPRVTYHDATNGALLFVTRDGGSWNDPVVVDDAGVAGRYGDMTLVGDAPVVAYRAHDVVLEDYAGASAQVGRVTTSLRWAAAADAAGSSWIVEDAVTVTTPCWGTVCPEGTRCRIADGLCWSEDEEACEGGCDPDKACLEDLDGEGTPLGTWGCQDAVALEPITDLPEGIAIWCSLDMDPGGLPEIVYYDRTAGDLVWVRGNGAGWEDPVVLDGDESSADPADHGDRGWHPTLAIDADGTRHIAYVDGLDESLIYLQLDPDGTRVVREVVDDGTSAGGEGDLVGDYSDIAVDADGRVRLVYQNSTQGLVMMAVRDPSDGSWSVGIASDPDGGFMGYYANQLVVDGVSWISQFTFNYEAEPYFRGLRVFSCTVGADGTPACG